MTIIIPADRLLSQLLDTNGDGTGTTDMAIDGTIPVEFKLTPPIDKLYIVESFTFVASGSTAIDSITEYIDLPQLTNGCLFEVTENFGASVKKDLVGNPIISNLQLLLTGADFTNLGNANAPSLLNFVERYREVYGEALQINGKNTEELKFIIRDNISALDFQFLEVYGRIIDL